MDRLHTWNCGWKNHNNSDLKQNLRAPKANFGVIMSGANYVINTYSGSDKWNFIIAYSYIGF